MEHSNLTQSVDLTEEVVRAFKEKHGTRALLPGDEKYEAARKIWNGMIDKKPTLIVQCQDKTDVINAVNLARAHNIPIAIKSGGHNVSGNAVCNQGVMIDLSQMKSIKVDPEKKIAVAEAGITWGEFDAATQKHGLATTGGLISTTGVAGLTLGGGVGWLVRKHGMSCDNLIEAEIVTADGKILKANVNENPELLWGIRGGGGNFGVVISMTFKLYKVETVLGGMIIHPQDKAKEVIKFYRDFMKTAPHEITLYSALLTSPEGFPIVAILGCYCGDITTGEEIIKPIRQFGSPIADMFQPMPYQQLQTMLDAGFPHGNRYYWKSSFLKDLSDDAIDVIVSNAASVSSPFTGIVIEFYGGASNQEPEGGASYPHRENEFDLVIISNWPDRDNDEKNISWTRKFYDEMQAYSSHRVYVNALGVEGADRVREAYGTNYQRLAKLKSKYDPQNLFRYNQNISPE